MSQHKLKKILVLLVIYFFISIPLLNISSAVEMDQTTKLLIRRLLGATFRKRFFHFILIRGVNYYLGSDGEIIATKPQLNLTGDLKTYKREENWDKPDLDTLMIYFTTKGVTLDDFYLVRRNDGRIFKFNKEQEMLISVQFDELPQIFQDNMKDLVKKNEPEEHILVEKEIFWFSWVQLGMRMIPLKPGLTSKNGVYAWHLAWVPRFNLNDRFDMGAHVGGHQISIDYIGKLTILEAGLFALYNFNDRIFSQFEFGQQKWSGVNESFAYYSLALGSCLRWGLLQNILVGVGKLGSNLTENYEFKLAIELAW